MNNAEKKIYIVTFHHVLNNGGLLQAYALVKFLRSKHLDAEILNYKPWYFLLQTYRPAIGIKKSISKIKKILAFRKFRRKNLSISTKSYYTSKSLKKINNATAFICGSDQIWNRSLTGGSIDPAYYLNFADSSAKKIAYAASAGSSSVASAWSSIGPLLKNFSAVGLREKATYLEIAKLAPELKPKLVVDPSLLIDNYDAIADFTRVPKGDFLLTYIVGSGESLRLFDEFVLNSKKIINLPVVHIGAKNIDSCDFFFDGVGPDEWVAFFKSAKFVITNSFHGTAFSVNFQKQFIFFPNCNELLNERQMTLLSSLGIEDRRLTELTEPSEDTPLSTIDYEIVTPRLNSMVEESSKFLLGSLTENKNTA